MYLPAALHGIEVSLLASDSLRKLRSSIHRVVWSRRQPLASVGCDPAFCVVWFGFRLFRGYLALWPSQVGRAYRLLEMVRKGCPGHGPIHLLSASAAEIGFGWNPDALAWVCPGLPLLSNLAGPFQHLKTAILDAWRDKVSVDLYGRRGFRGGPLLDVHGSWQLLNSSHVRESDKALLRSIMVGGVWNGYLHGKVREQPVQCRICGAPDNDGHLLSECTFPPLVEIRENPEFHDLMRMDKAHHWPRCLLWHGWLPMLSGVKVFLLGLLMLLIVFFIWLRLLSVGTHLVWVLSGVSLKVLMLMRSLPVCLMLPKFGLMVVWFWTRSLAFLPLAVVFLLTSLSCAGGVF